MNPNLKAYQAPVFTVTSEPDDKLVAILASEGDSLLGVAGIHCTDEDVPQPDDGRKRIAVMGLHGFPGKVNVVVGKWFKVQLASEPAPAGWTEVSL